MDILNVKNLTAGYGKEKIFSEICFSVENNALVGILGGNGCGKTTLLKALCGILPCSGQRILQGADIGGLPPRQLAQKCRYIPQRSGISIDISALDVVLMGFNPNLSLLQSPTADMRRRAVEALESVGMSHRAQENFQSLSEGQKQLCILARTLLLEEGVLFLDEPESALDFGGRYRILGLVRAWLQGGSRAALVTLHDPQLALAACDKLLLMKDGAILGEIHPKTDSDEEIQFLLSKLYGPLSVHRCPTRTGTAQLVLVKEEDL